MYKYVTDKQFLSAMHSLCADTVNRLVQRVNNNSVMEVEAHLVGSGAKNLILQNAKNPIDLDYNLCIIDTDFRSGEDIRKYIKDQFDAVLREVGWGTCNDSTSALSTKDRAFSTGNQTKFHIDLAIVRKRGDRWERLIHKKTGIIASDEWYWNEARNSNGLEEKVCALKENKHWNEVRDVYCQKKNMYLCRNDHDHPSFIVYIETINEVYGNYFPFPPSKVRSLDCGIHRNLYY